MVVGSEDVDFVWFDIDLQLFCQVIDVVQFFVLFEYLVQLGDFFFVMVGVGFDVGFFVVLVCVDFEFCFFVYGVGMDLYFQYFFFGVDYCGMQ